MMEIPLKLVLPVQSQLTPTDANNGDDTSRDPPWGNSDEATHANTTTTPTSSPHHATEHAPFLDVVARTSKPIDITSAPTPIQVSHSSLNIFYFDVRNLVPKIDNLRIFCSMYHPDIICIVESWLSTEISDSEISIQGYSVIRLDRNRHGGGVLIYVKSMFTYSLVFKGTTDLELIVASFLCTKQGTNPGLTLALFYRSPNSSSFVIVYCSL